MIMSMIDASVVGLSVSGPGMRPFVAISANPRRCDLSTLVAGHGARPKPGIRRPLVIPLLDGQRVALEPGDQAKLAARAMLIALAGTRPPFLPALSVYGTEACA